MQLPRGTFRTIRKGVNFSDILVELASSRFTGMCNLSSQTINGTLVFRSGICVLAKIQDFYGDQGWGVLMEHPDLTTDLAISDFNTAQIQLALDFNKNAIVYSSAAPPAQKPAHIPPLRSVERSSRDSGRHTAHSKREQKKHETPKPPGSSVEATAATAPPRKEPGEHTTVKSDHVDVVSETIPEKSGSAEELDLDMFDKMDLDDVALKIRKDCKIILKQLQLDHLTEK